MKKFDRVTSILIHLQTRQLVRAKDLAEQFDVTERTIYRDIRTLENAGVPIVAEPGVGYYLDKAYTLPPVMFSRDETAALLIGSKIIENQVDDATLGQFQQAMNKVRSVLDSADRHYLDIIDKDIVVQQPPRSTVTASDDKWLRECRTALARMQATAIEYGANTGQTLSSRIVEPVGLYFYAHHWHLIAWCRLREDYRDFRLDRIRQLALLSEQFRRRNYKSLRDYLQQTKQYNSVHEIKLLFTHQAAQYVDEQRHYFGFVAEEITEEGVEMVFLVPFIQYFAGWLLQYTDGVEVLSGNELQPAISQVLAELDAHWSNK